MLGTMGVACLLEWAASTALRVALPSGPYGLIFANFVTFALAVPPLQKFTLFGRQLSDKVRVRSAGELGSGSAPQMRPSIAIKEGQGQSQGQAV